MPSNSPHATPLARSLALAAAAALISGAALAESFAASAISNSVSASVGSISTSFNASSDASSPGRPLRAGAYVIEQMVAAPGRAGYVRLTLRAAAAPQPEAGEVHLVLPQETVQRAALATGQTITAAERPFGLAFSHAKERGGETFFLVMADDWYRELHTRQVKL
jgi:hypothetical protein